ncbi:MULTISPECIES: phosphoribosylglycinamide formyltransferase [unclassified Desulfovibrio]|uniref:phosphoribosylglycinamide formyltransferase n=1 Tax=unclassified Desulfovibrio TaxID=2593640 RepID=UPI0013ED9770|nr:MULTISPECIES: phosphoribosylglycinamide formyltransferase [unclassified Desulfovibrio]
MPLKIAILASGSGTNAQAMIDKARAGVLDVDIRLVVSNRPGAGVLERAAKAGVPSMVLDHTEYPAREAHDAAMVEALKASGAEYIVLAGYMRILTPVFLEAFAGRVLNIHPALLPSFPGAHGGADALAYGVKLTGCSVHFVEEEMDAGPLIIQAAVPVNAGEPLETLMPRIHALEHRIYPQALQWLAEGRIRRDGRQVYLAPGSAKRVRQDGDWLVWPPLEEGF